jgi:hypothetical protein
LKVESYALIQLSTLHRFSGNVIVRKSSIQRFAELPAIARISTIDVKGTLVGEMILAARLILGES